MNIKGFSTEFIGVIHTVDQRTTSIGYEGRNTEERNRKPVGNQQTTFDKETKRSCTTNGVYERFGHFMSFIFLWWPIRKYIVEEFKKTIPTDVSICDKDVSKVTAVVIKLELVGSKFGRQILKGMELKSCVWRMETVVAQENDVNTMYPVYFNTIVVFINLVSIVLATTLYLEKVRKIKATWVRIMNQSKVK